MFQDCYPDTEIPTDDGPFQKQQNCFDYYNSMLVNGSTKLPGTDFYFQDVQNGRINYLGWIKYKLPGKE